jgi:ribose 5-phosphate isomerase B
LEKIMEVERIVGIAADHGGMALKGFLIKALESEGFTVKDFGAYEQQDGDDYPDYVIPLARALSGERFPGGLRFAAAG